MRTRDHHFIDQKSSARSGICRNIHRSFDIRDIAGEGHIAFAPDAEGQMHANRCNRSRFDCQIGRLDGRSNAVGLEYAHRIHIMHLGTTADRR